MSETQQAGWTQSYPDIPGDGDWDVTLTSGQNDTGNDFGNCRNATKSGSKFEDLDADGQPREAGEPGLSGWTINLVGTAGDGSPVNLSTTTDATGTYSFSVKPGTYTVSETQQAGWTQSYPDIPGDGDWDVTLTSGQNDTGNDFGNWRHATKSGIKYDDRNGNRARDVPQTGSLGEPGLSGWTITAFAEIAPADGILQQPEIAAGVAASAVTDANGNYSLTLKPGRYIVVETMQAGWNESPDADTTQVNPDGRGGFGRFGYAITLTSGQTDSGNDFGNVLPTGGGQGGGGGPEKGGGGEGGGGGQPPTDMLIPTDTVSAASGPLDSPMNWILMILMSATVILSAGWVIRRVRTSEI